MPRRKGSTVVQATAEDQAEQTEQAQEVWADNNGEDQYQNMDDNEVMGALEYVAPENQDVTGDADAPVTEGVVTEVDPNRPYNAYTFDELMKVAPGDAYAQGRFPEYMTAISKANSAKEREDQRHKDEELRREAAEKFAQISKSLLDSANERLRSWVKNHHNDDFSGLPGHTLIYDAVLHQYTMSFNYSRGSAGNSSTPSTSDNGETNKHITSSTPVTVVKIANVRSGRPQLSGVAVGDKFASLAELAAKVGAEPKVLTLKGGGIYVEATK